MPRLGEDYKRFGECWKRVAGIRPKTANELTLRVKIQSHFNGHQHQTPLPKNVEKCEATTAIFSAVLKEERDDTAKFSNLTLKR